MSRPVKCDAPGCEVTSAATEITIAWGRIGVMNRNYDLCPEHARIAMQQVGIAVMTARGDTPP